MTQDTKTEILDTAQRLTSKVGFDAFSYRDISEAVKIKTSSIHYHFPTKSDLAEALIERYTSNLVVALDDLAVSGKSGFDQIKSLFTVICDQSGKERNFCLCGMLAADIHTISEVSKGKLSFFFTTLEKYIQQMLEQGLKDKSVHKSIRAKSTAAEITAAFEGAMLIARVRNNDNYLQDTLDIILARLHA